MGVIELSSSITMNDFTAPIPLVNTGTWANPKSSRYLKFTDTNYVSVRKCRRKWPGQTIDNSVQCADKKGATICSGDSGGPLVREIDGQYQLIGATSWAHTNCASYGRPQGWSNLYDSTYNAWTRQQAGL